MNRKLLPYEKAGRVFRLLGWIQVGLFLLIFFGFLLSVLAHDAGATKDAWIMLVFLVSPVFYLTLGRAIMDHKPWGKTVGIILGVIMLFGFPIGTLIGGYVLLSLMNGWDVPDGQEEEAEGTA
ncbi:MAG: hypothetical protein PVJ40_03370 [Gammaproteobacteria bacterium]